MPPHLIAWFYRGNGMEALRSQHPGPNAGSSPDIHRVYFSRRAPNQRKDRRNDAGSIAGTKLGIVARQAVEIAVLDQWLSHLPKLRSNSFCDVNRPQIGIRPATG